MKFLPKNPQSTILAEGLIYTKDTAKNQHLRDRLLTEQRQFCAYTEKRLIGTGSIEIEHFDAVKKWSDDYFNYYAAIRQANLAKRKKDRRFANASFFQTLFFHDKVELEQRIIYVDSQYDTINPNDIEAQELIDYLSMNDEWLFSERANHLELLRQTFDDANYDKSEQVNFLIRHPKMLDYITAIEQEFEIDLSAVYI